MAEIDKYILFEALLLLFSHSVGCVDNVQMTFVDILVIHSGFLNSSFGLINTVQSGVHKANAVLQHANVEFTPYFIPNISKWDYDTSLSDNIEHLLAKEYYESLNFSHKTIVISLNCTDDLRIGNMTKFWDILYVTTGRQCKQYPAAHEVYLGMQSTENYAQILLDVLRLYRWYNVFFFVDNALDIFLELYAAARAAISQFDDMDTSVQFFTGQDLNASMTQDLLYTFKEQSRILIVISPGLILRSVLIEAAHLGMTNGQFMYIGMERWLHGEKDFHWEQGDSFDAIARSAFQSLLIISSILNKGLNLHQLMEMRAMATATAVQAIAQVLNDLPHSLLDTGSQLSTHFAHKTFSGIADHLVYVSQQRLRVTNMTNALVWNVRTGTFTNIHQICWPNGVGPPENVPRCGYRGDEAPCQMFSLHYQGLFAGVVGTLYLCGVGYVLATMRIRSHNTRDDRWWDIKMSLITRVAQAHHNVSTRNLLTGMASDKDRTAAAIAGDKFVGQALLHNENVWIKFIYFNPMNVSASANLIVTAATRTLLQNLGNCLHINVCKFYGLFTISTGYSQRVYAVDEYCERGNLHGLLEIRNLDWSFRSSLMVDLLEGMAYIHSKPIGYHGHLNEFKCLINRRFMLKIGETGLDRIKRQLLANSYTGTADMPPNKLYWTAPELLRNAAQPNQATDVYSVGILLYQMLVWTEPYDEQTEQYTNYII
ncbi:atrial natriuretic peptide receptor 1-like [Paramacrobiotus metropolitanus]|uniref:atrial natriuretic peptide receptor 1-like n=1 Tax=Paramacrobiotus metropolitanus TaxID=2943436 RepID=UPI0024459819|nr:atrial natriuretic peptide receptor 1-like [Paramacrobiotus metropolitanus]